MTDNKEAVEAVARAMALANDSNWNALNFNETPNGSDPEEERDHWRHCAITALAAARPFHFEEAARIAERAHRGPVPGGDGGTYISGSNVDAAAAIRAVKEG